jgi:hypothetical protein
MASPTGLPCPTAFRVGAFGAVFTDVDLPNSTSLQFFDSANNSLGVFFVPAAAGSGTLSFLGVLFNAGERVARVGITSGNAALGAGVNDGGATDLVVMDDSIYAEPQAPGERHLPRTPTRRHSVAGPPSCDIVT